MVLGTDRVVGEFLNKFEMFIFSTSLFESCVTDAGCEVRRLVSLHVRNSNIHISSDSMDVGAFLAEAADEALYENDGDFEQQEVPSTSLSKQSASDILKASANEVAYKDKIEAEKAFRREADDIDHHDGERNSAVAYSSDLSPERIIGKASAPSTLDETSENSSPSEVRATAGKNAQKGQADDDSDNGSYDAKSMDREDKKTIIQNDEDQDDRNNDDIEDDDNNDDDNDSDHSSDADPVMDAELLVAAYQGNVKKVDKLLSSGARYLARDRHRWTALMWAAAGGHDDVIESLISCVKKHKLKSYLNAKDGITGWTVLHVSYHNLSSSKLFLCIYPVAEPFINWIDL